MDKKKRGSSFVFSAVFRANKQGYLYLLMGLAVFLLFSITWSITLGPVNMPAVTAWKIILSHAPWVDNYIEADWNKAQEHIIWNIRVPRVLLGTVTGAGLAVAGVVIQALVRNSLADPYILGVSSGASVVATLVILFGALPVFGQYALTTGAFTGAMIAMGAVYIIAQEGGKILTTRLLLAGVAVSMTLSAVTNFIVTLAPKESGIREVMFWMMGSLAGAKWEHLAIPTLIIAGSVLFLLSASSSLNALLMGEEAAGTLGVNTDVFRKILIVVASLITGAVVAVSGSIGFVGLMVPHLARLLLGSDHKRVIPVSALLGMLVVIWSDTAARLLLAPEELPIGVVTAFCGGPFFIWLLRHSSYSFGGGGR
ncbi:ABC transporter permease [Bacillus sp. PK3_68]|nr:ABC transporter permease [Bacillus sp. PK3_68]